MHPDDRYLDYEDEYTGHVIAIALRYYFEHHDEDGIPVTPHPDAKDTRDHQVASLQCTVEDQKRALDMLQKQFEILTADRDHWRNEASELESLVANMRIQMVDLESRQPQARGILRTVWDSLSHCRTRDL